MPSPRLNFEGISADQGRKSYGDDIYLHDLGAVSKIADEIVVMNGGKLVEQGDFEHILRHAKDPYTRMLAETRRSVMERYRLCLDNQEELCLN